MGLSSGQVLGLFEVAQIFVISDNDYWVFCASEIVMPLFECLDDCEEFPVAHAPPAMVFFFLFFFTPLFAAFLLTIYIVLCKPGCAISAADTSSV